MNFDPGQDTPLLSGACKATKHHSMLITKTVYILYEQRKEFSYNRPGICLLMSSVWAGILLATTTNSDVSSDEG